MPIWPKQDPGNILKHHFLITLYMKSVGALRIISQGVQINVGGKHGS